MRQTGAAELAADHVRLHADGSPPYHARATAAGAGCWPTGRLTRCTSRPSSGAARLYEKVGPLREDLHLITDYDYWLRISRPCSAGEDARLMSAYIQPFAKRQRHVLRPAGRNAEVVHDEHTHRRQALPVSAEPMRAAVAVLRWNRSAARRRVFADRRKFPA
jgi:hypothetical protein